MVFLQNKVDMVFKYMLVCTNLVGTTIETQLPQ